MNRDKFIWDKFKEGDDDALNLIYFENFSKLYHYGLKFSGNHTVIEDALQDMFTDLVRNRSTLSSVENIRFYLLKSFKRRLIRQLQKEYRYNLTREHDEINFEITYSVESDLISSENRDLRLKALHQAIAGLTPRQKEAIFLRFTEELEYNQIAEIMQMSVEACRNIIFRAVKALKESVQLNTTILFFLLKGARL